MKNLDDDIEPTDAQKEDLHAGIEANLAGEPRDETKSEAWLLGWDEAKGDVDENA